MSTSPTNGDPEKNDVFNSSLKICTRAADQEGIEPRSSVLQRKAMFLSAALCRAQELIQRERATGSALANVRQVAQMAANAWEAEALLADHREQRRMRTRVVAADLMIGKRLARERLDRSVNESPDQGFAHA